VLFRRAIQLSLSSEHWAEVTYVPGGKALGADLPTSPVMLNPQFKGAQPIDVYVVPGGQVVRRIRSSGHVGPFHLEAAHSSISLRVAGSRNKRAMLGGFHHERPGDSGSEGHCT
jgi:hypothetical protein